MKNKKIKTLLILAILLLATLIINSNTVKATSVAWDGTTEEPTATRRVDGKTYYEISNAKQLAYIAETGGIWLNRNYILVDDIILNDVEIESTESGALQTDPAELKEWHPIAGKEEETYLGTFNGNGHKITGLYINDITDKEYTDSEGSIEQRGTGLFGMIEGDIKNLNIENAYIKAVSHVGGIAGCGNFLGHSNTGNIDNCTFDGKIIGTNNVGGIIGFSMGRVTNCTNKAEITGTRLNDSAMVIYIGGITGNYALSIVNCINKGNVIAEGGECVGGIMGNGVGSEISKCSNLGNVEGVTRVGGILGDADAGITNCYNIGRISGYQYVGGIAGDNYRIITNSYNTGTIEGAEDIGGIAGKSEETLDWEDSSICYTKIEKCYNIGKVYYEKTLGSVINGKNIGSIVGQNIYTKSKNVVNCYYLKDTSTNVNNEINGIGNDKDQKNIVEAKLKQFFPIYTNSNSDPGYDKLGYPTYTVTFKNDNGQVLKTQKVEYGSSATPPTNPSKEGYTFVGWDKTYTNITSNLTVTARYTKRQYKLGDINKDGKIDTKDARLALLAYVGKEKLTIEQRALADVNKDGKVDTKDARQILLYYVGKIKNF